MPSTFILPGQDRAADIGRLTELLYAACPGRRVKVVVSEYRETRTQKQLNALWGVAYKAIREQTGNDSADLHVYFCGEWFGWVEKKVMGQVQRVPARTTTTDEDGHEDVLDIEEMRNFYSFVQYRAAQVGVDVPDPDPTWNQPKPPLEAYEE